MDSSFTDFASGNSFFIEPEDAQTWKLQWKQRGHHFSEYGKKLGQKLF